MNKNRWKRYGVLYFALIFILIPALASAYIDPSATTFLIQAIAGIAIAVGSVAVIFWRRAKKKIKDKVGIDLDKNKETEEAVVMVKAEEKE